MNKAMSKKQTQNKKVYITYNLKEGVGLSKDANITTWAKDWENIKTFNSIEQAEKAIKERIEACETMELKNHTKTAKGLRVYEFEDETMYYIIGENK